MAAATDQGVVSAQYVQRNLRWNFVVSVVDIVFYTFGVNMVARDTVVPFLISRLTASTIAVGLVPAIWAASYYLPQLLVSNYSERLRYRKPFVVLLGGLTERVPYLLMGIAVWVWAAKAPSIALVALLGLLALTACSDGIATPAWYDMVAKVIPVERRGAYAGVGQGLGTTLGVAGAMLGGTILATRPYPTSFALCYLLAFASMAISWVGLALTREPPSTVVRPKLGVRQHLAELWPELRANPNYAHYVISKSVTILGAMGTGFLMVYGVTRFGVSGRQVGFMTACLVGSQAIMSLAWGAVGDRLGHKRVLVGAGLAMAVTVATATLARSSSWLYGVFALLGVASAGDSVSAMNIILEFTVPEKRPTYIGLTNSLFAPVKAVAPLLGGLLATAAGYKLMFVVAGVASLGGALLLALWVREPRRMLQAESRRR